MIEVAVANPTAPWELDWLWGVPLIIVTVVFHVLGLGLINRGVVAVFGGRSPRKPSTLRFVAVMGSVAGLATVLHAVEAIAWAVSYYRLQALPDMRLAMLYSLGALTSYGHAEIFLDRRWQLMGALEALNGIMLFGLTTAFLFFTLQRVWPVAETRA